MIRPIHGKHDVEIYLVNNALFGLGLVDIFDDNLIVLNSVLQYLASLRNLELLN